MSDTETVGVRLRRALRPSSVGDVSRSTDAEIFRSSVLIASVVMGFGALGVFSMLIWCYGQSETGVGK